MQVFMGQAWADHSDDFLSRALRADRITFADLGSVVRSGMMWIIEHPTPEASDFIAIQRERTYGRQARATRF
jgi:hypothetical protein